MTPDEAKAFAARYRPARSHTDEVLARYDETDARLVAAGFPPSSPWWRATFERWYRSGKRQLVVRAGRRAGKSSSLSRLAVVEALFGLHAVPPGDLGTVAIIAQNRTEGAKRLRTVTAILDALGVSYAPLGGSAVGVELVGRRVCFQVFAGSIAGVSGFTGVFVLCDEVAKWLDADTGANPATEVLASVRPTMATQPNARLVLSSSPLGRLDAHFDAFELGETSHQVTAYAPTWEANPTVTEAQTRADEPDESTWRREYLAEPQAEAESSLLTETIVDRVTRKGGDVPPEHGHTYVAAIDPASRGNAFTLIVATRTGDVRRIVLARDWTPKGGLPLELGVTFAEIATLIAPYGLSHAYTDQFAADPLVELARHARLSLVPKPWTAQTKAEGYQELQAHAVAGNLELPNDAQLRQDMLGIRKRLTRNGVTYDLAMHGSRHSDYAPAVAMAVMEARYPAEVAVTVTAQQALLDHETRLMELAEEEERERQERDWWQA
jgi:hypothetical protein